MKDIREILIYDQTIDSKLFMSYIYTFKELLIMQIRFALQFPLFDTT